MGHFYFEENLIIKCKHMFEDWDSDNGISKLKIFRYHIPRNKEELEQVKEILKTQDFFDRKMSVLFDKLDKIFKQIDYKELNLDVSNRFTWLRNELDSVIINLFALELGKTEYKLENLKARHYPEFIIGRQIPCEICGENRVVERCHILPNRMGGSLALENIFFLCPLHHKLLDNYLLTQQEFAKLNLSDKAPKSIEYFNAVIEPNMKKFWESGDKQNFELEKEFRLKFKKEVIEYIKKNQPIDLKDTIRHFIYAYREAEQIIFDLKNKNYLVQNKEGKLIINLKMKE